MDATPVLIGDVRGRLNLTNADRLTQVASAGTISEAAIADGVSGDVLTISATLTAPRALTLPDQAVTITAAGAALIDDADASAQRSTLGLGSIATQAANNVAITGGSITGLTALSTGADGMDVNPGSDIDADIYTVNVTGSPRQWWDESENAIAFTHKIIGAAGISSTTLTASGSLILNGGVTQFPSEGGGLTLGCVNNATNSYFFTLAGNGTSSTLLGGGVTGDNYRRIRLTVDGEFYSGNGAASATSVLKLSSTSVNVKVNLDLDTNDIVDVDNLSCATITMTGKITGPTALPASFADLAAVRTFLATLIA